MKVNSETSRQASIGFEVSTALTLFFSAPGYGMYKNGKTTFVNAATVGPGYKPINPPVVFHLEKS